MTFQTRQWLKSIGAGIPTRRSQKSIKKGVHKISKLTKYEYRKVHFWIAKQCGKACKCELCKVENLSMYHWSNISGEYRLDISDWQQLCPKCHYKYDEKTAHVNRYVPPRKDVCKNGHILTESSTRLRVSGTRTWRVCKECQANYLQAFKQRKELLCGQNPQQQKCALALKLQCM